MTKTNALRLLEAAGIPYETREYEFDDEHPTGFHDGDDPALREITFKTLVARGERLGILVFVLPISEELDLRKAAAAAGDKKVEMIHMKEILGLTGYIRGGCSPVGMKKQYPTIFDETALLYDSIYVSAGQRGLSMRVNTQQLLEYTGALCADLTR